MDDFEYDEEWYQSIFLDFRNHRANPVSMHEWFEEIHTVIKSARFQPPKFERLTLVVFAGIFLTRTGSKSTYGYRHE